MKRYLSILLLVAACAAWTPEAAAAGPRQDVVRSGAAGERPSVTAPTRGEASDLDRREQASPAAAEFSGGYRDDVIYIGSATFLVLLIVLIILL